MHKLPPRQIRSLMLSILRGGHFPTRPAKTEDRVAAASTELETIIDSNPLMAVLAAMIAGIAFGMLARGCK